MLSWWGYPWSDTSDWCQELRMLKGVRTLRLVIRREFNQQSSFERFALGWMGLQDMNGQRIPLERVEIYEDNETHVKTYNRSW